MSTKFLAKGLVAALSIAMQFACMTAQAGYFETTAKLNQGETFAATDPMFESVVWLRGEDDGGGGFFAGTGILITPWDVLTQGHVALNNDDTPRNLTHAGFADSIFDDPFDRVDIESVLVYPGYTTSAPIGHNNDIALVRLSEPVFDITPATRFRDAVVPGMHFYAAGYGNPRVFGSSEQPFDGVLRAGENIVDSIGSDLFNVNENYFIADNGFVLSSTALPLEWAGTVNDSGGGWWTDVDGEWQLFANSSFRLGDNTRTGATSIPFNNAWIDANVVVIPEPSSVVMLVAGLPFVYLVVRRRRS